MHSRSFARFRAVIVEVFCVPGGEKNLGISALNWHLRVCMSVYNTLITAANDWPTRARRGVNLDLKRRENVHGHYSRIRVLAPD